MHAKHGAHLTENILYASLYAQTIYIPLFQSKLAMTLALNSYSNRLKTSFTYGIIWFVDFRLSWLGMGLRNKIVTAQKLIAFDKTINKNIIQI